MSLLELTLVLVLGLVGLVVWRHAQVGRAAYRVACVEAQRQELLLLDQTVVLKKLRLRPSRRSLFAVERVFQFEFATLGDVRYFGTITFNGPHLAKISLPAYKTGRGVEPIQ